jgi:hypothetical protein
MTEMMSLEFSATGAVSSDLEEFPGVQNTKDQKGGREIRQIND